MRNFRYSGQSLTFTAAEPLVSGQAYLLGNAFGIVSNTLVPGQSGELFLTGVWKLPKGTHEIPIGWKVYWDQAAKVVTSGAGQESSGLILIGLAAESASAEAREMDVRLNGVSI